MLEILDPVLHNPWQCRDCLGCLYVDLCNKSCIGLYEAGNDREIWVHKVNR